MAEVTKAHLKPRTLLACIFVSIQPFQDHFMDLWQLSSELSRGQTMECRGALLATPGTGLRQVVLSQPQILPRVLSDNQSSDGTIAKY